MNRPALALLAGSAVLAATTGLSVAQQTIISTRTFNNQVFDLTPTFASGDGQISRQLGLDDLYRENGTPVLVEISLQLVWDIDLDFTNNSSITGSFAYNTPIDLAPVPRDCAAYSYTTLGGFSSQVAPGQIANVDIDRTTPFHHNFQQFNTACGAPWAWNSAVIWTSILDGTPRITGPFGGPVPASWIQVNSADLTVNGSVTITWEPTPLPFQTICPGTESPSVLLEPAGGVQNRPDVYLFQTGAPSSLNLLARSDNATNTVNPITGLCITGAVVRVPGTVNQGGIPLRLPNVSALSGTVTYFQSWFRTPGVGNSGTSECVSVQFP